jgi:hypothetical protein
MANRLREFLDGSRKRIGYIVGGVLIALDNIGRIQVIKGMWAELKTAWATVHPAWPSHLLTWIGVGFVVFGFVSSFWPNRTANAPFVGQPAVITASNEADLPLPQPSSDGRVILGRGLTPAYFMKELRGKTTYDVERATQIYIDKWMRFEGEIEDIRWAEGSGEFRVTFKQPPGESYVSATFANTWSDHMSIKRAGERISLIGKIRVIERDWIWLVESALEK